MPTKKTTEQSELSFEQALGRLDEIANILENENPELDKALALYEEGAKLLKESMGKLKDAESKITILSKSE